MRLSLRVLLFTAVSVSAQQPATSSQGNFAGPSLYDLLQRQNQLNNALLLNHALISNSMAANLHDNHLHPPPQFNFPQQSAANLGHLHLYPQHMQGLLPPNLQGSSAEKLAIYDALLPMTPPAPSELPTVAQLTKEQKPQPVVSGVVQVPATKPSSEIVYLTSENKKVKSQDFHDLNDESKSFLKIKAIEKTVVATTEETTTLPSATTAPPEAPPSIPDVFQLLQHLNLTKEESDKLVHHVEQVVREELARKLIETKLSAITLAPRAAPTHKTTETPSTTTVAVTTTTVQATSVEEENGSDEEAAVTEDTTSPATETTLMAMDRSERLLESDIPEIKLHPPRRIADKDEGGYVKTSETHLVLEMEKERNEEEEETPREGQGLEKMAPSAVPITAAPSTTENPKPEEFDPKRVSPIPRRSFLETDSDLLALATGAPLDLNEETAVHDAAYRNRLRTTRPPILHRVTKPSMPSRMLRPNTPPTQFVQLADDYRQRLSGTEDVSKLLKAFYENAFIQLVSNEADPRKISKPREIQLAQARGRR